MARTLVTGGAGFIGSHLVDLLLENGHEVVVVDNFATGRPHNIEHHRANPKFSFIQADIRDLEALRPAFGGVDWVFHLAALADIVPSITSPVDYFETNVTGTMNVLEAARAAGAKRFVYAASSSCYGIPDEYPTGETAEIRPQYPYALTKNLGEQTVRHWGQIYKMPNVCLRLFNVYGPRARTSGTYGAVFGVFLAQKLKGLPLTIVGDGTQTRDFIYVADVARAFMMAAASGLDGEVMNVGNGNPVAVNRIAELIGGERVHLPKRPGEPDSTHADISRIKEKLGWKANVPIEEGVANMLADLSHWKDAPAWTPDKIAEATKDWFKYLQKS